MPYETTYRCPECKHIWVDWFSFYGMECPRCGTLGDWGDEHDGEDDAGESLSAGTGV